MDSSLTLKQGCNHGVKRRVRRTAAALGPDAVVKNCLFWGSRPDFCFFLFRRGRRLTSPTAASKRLPLHVCFTQICHRLHYLAWSPGPCFTDSGLESTQEVFVFMCVFRCVRQSCCSSPVTSLHKQATAGEQLPTRTPPSSLSSPVPVLYIPSPPQSFHPSLVPRLFPLSEWRVRQEDSIPQCNCLLPCGSL